MVGTTLDHVLNSLFDGALVKYASQALKNGIGALWGQLVESTPALSDKGDRHLWKNAFRSGAEVEAGAGAVGVGWRGGRGGGGGRGVQE